MPQCFFLVCFPFKKLWLVLFAISNPLSLSTITNPNPSIMINALRKIKNWSSRKKKRRKSNIYQPPSYPHCCSCGTPPPLPPLQPTAPPLPSWLDFDYQQDSASESVPASTFPTQHQFELQSPDITSSEITPLYVPQSLPIATSYQQYLVPAPVYGMPVAPSTPVNSPRRGSGFCGWIASVVSRLIRCLCPCIQFHQNLN